MRAPWLPLLLAAPLAACGSDPALPAPGGIVVTASVDANPILSGPDVTFRVENRSSDTVYLARCGERIMAAVDRREGDRWVAYRSDACRTDLRMDPLRLAPGESATDRHAVQIPGRYRLRLGASRSPGEAPVWDVASHEFEVTT